MIKTKKLLDRPVCMIYIVGMKQVTKRPARERITEVAAELFYKQGFRATGINEVIEKSGVAKATFYSHFPSKDDLGLVYLEELHEGEIEALERTIAEANDPIDRFLSVISSLKPWLTSTDFRGCGFLNMASEIPDASHPLRKQGVRLYDDIRERVTALSKSLIDSDPEKYGHLEFGPLTDDYMVAFMGAVALAEIYHAVWPVDHALVTVRRLVDN